tara:strand:+ start:34717 stop:41325 length:6609 start_codon:yes stop_codon:yes gene_type:complete
MPTNPKVFELGATSVDSQGRGNQRTPTNPKFTTQTQYSSSLRASDSVEQTRLYTIIFPDHYFGTTGSAAITSGSFTEVGTSTANTIRFNLSTTSGSKIHCYDKGTGVLLNSTNYDEDYNYFVLIYANDHLKHHFAKITKVSNGDTEGDYFTFEPPLGDEIPANTEFMLFKGTHKTSNAVAFSAGIKVDLQDKLMCSRPLFYFLKNNDKYFTANLVSGNSLIAISTLAGLAVGNLQVGMNVSGKNIPNNTKISLITATHIVLSNNASANSTAELITIENYSRDYTLDEVDQLDHNVKYTAGMTTSNTNGTISSFSHSIFLTSPDFGNRIVDYSKFSMELELVDNLRALDVRATDGIGSGTTNSNEGVSVPTYDYSDYEEAFVNARRAVNDTILGSSTNRGGPTRYVHYDYSPKKSNIISNVLDMQLEESFSPRGGFSSAKIIDNSKMMNRKISEFNKYTVQHRVLEGELSEFVDLPARVNAYVSGRTYSFFTDHDLVHYINVGDEVKVGDYILIVEAIPGKSGTTQEIEFYDLVRTEEELQFSTSSSWSTLLSADQKMQRRAYNFTDRTLLTNFKIVENREKQIFVSIVSKDFEYLQAEVLNSDSTLGLLYLRFPENAYSDTENSMKYATGIYNIEIERFIGKVEKINAYKESQQNFIELEGRDEFSQLLGPIINKNTLFSEDIIYSTNSPYNTLTSLSSNGRFNFSSDEITNTSSISLAAGEKIFAQINGHFAYVGEVKTPTTSATTHVLTRKALAEHTTDVALYKSSNKNYALTKALNSNPLVVSETSLKGSANKGIYFTSGVTISSTGVEGDSLVGTSASNDEKGIGYFIHQPSGISSDNYFQCRLTNKDNSAFQTFDTVNTLLDFEIINTNEENGNTVLEIAPYMPLTLGRLEINYANTRDTTFNAIGEVHSTVVVTDKNYFTMRVADDGDEFLSTTSVPRKHHGKPVFLNGNFLGIINYVVLLTDYSTVQIFLDRKVTTTAGDTIQLLTYDGTDNESTKLTQELHLLNGSHLWNGKIISALSPNTTTSGEVFSLDYPKTFDSGLNSNYFKFYGSCHFNIYNLEKGNISSKQIATHSRAIEQPETYDYYSKPSKIKYYASAYRFGLGNTYSGVNLVDDIIGTDKFLSSTFTYTSPEARGYVPSLGSKFYDTIHHESGGSADIVALEVNPMGKSLTASIGGIDYAVGNAFLQKDYFNHLDPKIARMFLFSNSDLEPYSSLRADSLMSSSSVKDISSYNLFAKKKSIETSNSDTKYSSTGKTLTLKNDDNDYVSKGIISADKTLSDLTRFSIMRLTELCFDWAFNQFDPENIPEKNTLLPAIAIPQSIHTSTVSGGSSPKAELSTVNIIEYQPSGNLNDIKVDTTVNIAFASGGYSDIIYDINGRFVGKWVSQSASIVTLDAPPVKTNGTSNTCALGFRVEPLNITNDLFSGNGDSDSFIDFGKKVSMLKGIATQFSESNAVGWGKNGSRWETKYGAAFGEKASANSNTINLALPFLFDMKNGNGSTTVENTFKIFNIFRTMNRVSTASSVASNLYANNLIPIFLDRYSIEDGKSLASEGMSGNTITKAHANNANNSGISSTITMSCGTPPFQNNTDEDTNKLYDDTADGVFLAFKPTLEINGSTNLNADVTKGGENVYQTEIEATDENKFLDYVNLTGCYLVSEKHVYRSDSGSLVSSLGTSLNNGYPVYICYVISHEIDESNGTRTHILILDNGWTDGTTEIFRIMQPNHTCFHSFSPKEIQIRQTSSKYTKKPSTDSCYNGIDSFVNRNARGGKNTKGNDEGILSMYMLVDCDNKNNNTDEKHTVVRDYRSFPNILPSEPTTVLISDGENKNKTTISYKRDEESSGTEINNTITFGEMKEMLGVVSVSETINVTVNGEMDSDFDRCCIGTTAIVASETDELIDRLLKDNNINVDVTDSSFPTFLSPNFQGIDLYAAINYLLERKDKSIIYESDRFKVLDKKDASFYSDVILEEKGDLQLYDLQKEKNLLNTYNEIIVYGKGHKAKRKRSDSIKKIGLKTLEVYEPNLQSQEEVDKRARVLRELHSEDDNNRLFKVSVGHSGISQLRAGDLIRLDIPREGIENVLVIVLQIKHTLNGLMDLELGKYSKLLEDTFAEMQIENKKINTELRNNTFGEENIIKLDFEDSVKIKQLRFFVRKKSSSSSFKLGFGTVLNTGTTTLGYGVGVGITFTTLLDEDLA